MPLNRFHRYVLANSSDSRDTLEKSNSSQENVHVYDTTVYESGKKRLVFIACAHKYGGSRPFVRFMGKVFKETRPQLVLLEDSYKKERAYFNNYKSFGRPNWREKDWAAYLSERFNSGIEGMDEDTGFVNKTMLGLKDGQRILVYIWFYLYYHSLRGQLSKNFSDKDIYFITKYRITRDMFTFNGSFTRLGREIMRLKASYGLDLDKTLDKIINDVTEEYIVRKDPVSVINNDKYVSFSYSDRGKYKINEFTCLFMAIRDRRMYTACLEALNKHDRVVAIAGSNHVNNLRELLRRGIKNSFGDVRVMKGYEV